MLVLVSCPRNTRYFAGASAPAAPTNDESAHKSLGIWERRKLVVML